MINILLQGQYYSQCLRHVLVNKHSLNNWLFNKYISDLKIEFWNMVEGNNSENSDNDSKGWI